MSFNPIAYARSSRTPDGYAEWLARVVSLPERMSGLDRLREVMVHIPAEWGWTVELLERTAWRRAAWRFHRYLVEACHGDASLYSIVMTDRFTSLYYPNEIKCLATHVVKRAELGERAMAWLHHHLGSWPHLTADEMRSETILDGQIHQDRRRDEQRIYQISLSQQSDVKKGILCESCKSDDVSVNKAQLNSSDESDTGLYRCETCGHEWRER